MTHISNIYIDGAFTAPYGTEVLDLISPVTNRINGRVTLGDTTDTQRAIAAAKAALPAFSATTKEERIALLERIHASILARKQELIDVMVDEYGGPVTICTASVQNGLDAIASNISVLRDFAFSRNVGNSKVVLEPVGVVGIITPWNASNSFVCIKLSTAIAAGCTSVIKPSEMSARQTQLLTECLHEAEIPAGVFNIVNGLGTVVGAELTRHPDIAKISFTGSSAVGRTILRDGSETMKRITLELGGKSPNIVLDDADLATAIPLSVSAAFMNSGQACIAATRLLVPENRLAEVTALVRETVGRIVTGDPTDPSTQIGPMVSSKQYERVRSYIRLGISEGAELIAGGEGQPAGLEAGNFVQPTVFANVTNDMRIAREEIFGPVLSILTYRTEEEAVAIANDTVYGLAAYIQTSDPERGARIAGRLQAGRVSVNKLTHDPLAPFGGFKQSGIGREYGVYGLEGYLEPKTLLS